MNQEKIHLNPIILIGLSTRTANQHEMNPETAKIGSMMSYYSGKQISNEFKHRVNPGVTYSVYTDYESDEHGEYTYFLGEEVQSLDEQDIDQFNSIIIPAGQYQKFTVIGQLPNIVISAWQQIWQMTPADFVGKRNYKADFEVYDHRASDPHHATIDIYVGVEG